MLQMLFTSERMGGLRYSSANDPDAVEFMTDDRNESPIVFADVHKPILRDAGAEPVFICLWTVQRKLVGVAYGHKNVIQILHGEEVAWLVCLLS